MKKGPEHVPNSGFVLAFAIGLFIFSIFASEGLMQRSENDSILLSLAVSVMGYVIYWLVLLMTGFRHRFVPAVSCIMACGSILTIMTVVVFVLLKPLLGHSIALILAWLILMWAVPVKGHIIARSIEQHWYIGIMIAFVVYFVQRVTYEALTTYQVN